MCAQAQTGNKKEVDGVTSGTPPLQQGITGSLNKNTAATTVQNQAGNAAAVSTASRHEDDQDDDDDDDSSSTTTSANGTSGTIEITTVSEDLCLKNNPTMASVLKENAALKKTIQAMKEAMEEDQKSTAKDPSSLVTNEVKKMLNQMDRQLSIGLNDYVRHQFFKQGAFLTKKEQPFNACMAAVAQKYVLLPRGVAASDFALVYQKQVSRNFKNIQRTSAQNARTNVRKSTGWKEGNSSLTY
jgi:hypothetical protein